MEIHGQVFVGRYAFIALEYKDRVRIAQIVNLCLTLEKLLDCFPQ